MAVLDTSGAYSAGDDYRVIKVLGAPFGEYTLDCVAGCMNQLEVVSATAASDLVALLNAWDTANAAQSTQYSSQPDGTKVLTKADVLEWEVVNGGVSGLSQEKARIEMEVAQIMSFCSCLSGLMQNKTSGTPLIRS